VGVLANDSFHIMEVGRAKSRPSIHDATEVGAILLFDRGPRLKRDMGHRTVNGDGNRRLGGIAREDNDVLMESETPITTSRRARGRSCGTSDRQSHTPTVHGHNRTSAVLLKKHLTMLGGDFIPINRVEIFALCRLGRLAPPSRLKILDLSCSVFANAWLGCIEADNNKLSLLLPGPRVSQAASKTFVFDETPPGRITALGGIAPLRIALESGLGNTGKGWGRPPRGWIDEELLAPASICDDVEDVANVVSILINALNISVSRVR